MEILRFNDGSLKRELDRISVKLRVVFAATIAERLLPAYVSFSHKTGRGNAHLLAQILDRLWRDLDGIEMNPEELQQNIDLAMELIPREDEGPWIPDQAWAEDAATAVAYALRSRQNGKSQESVWAARHAYDALDHFVTTKEDIDPSTAGAEERIISNPLVQQEFMRQQRDLGELVAVKRQDESALIQKIRERAKAESASVFNSGS
jgi:uncharacterized protein YjaG (DUF416 family)